MSLTSLRDRLSMPLEWIARHIASRPKGALVLWLLSLVVAAWAI